MPIGEIETHPYLELGHIAGANRLILGSFPVYECTNPDSDLKAVRRNDGTVRFFYGSSRNRLWRLYGQYVDNQIFTPWNSDSILQSLAERRTAISDVIRECERYSFKKDKRTGERVIDPYSSDDLALHNQVLNVDQIRTLLVSGVSKVLCTSKGVLSTLEARIISFQHFGRVDDFESANFQSNFIAGIQGNPRQITKPSHRRFNVHGRTIHALAIPSPGSPYRRLHHFGFQGVNSHAYATAYFQRAFEWLVQ